MMYTEPTAAVISGYGIALLVTTVYESGAVTSMGLPPGFSRSCTEGWSFSS